MTGPRNLIGDGAQNALLHYYGAARRAVSVIGIALRLRAARILVGPGANPDSHAQSLG